MPTFNLQTNGARGMSTPLLGWQPCRRRPVPLPSASAAHPAHPHHPLCFRTICCAVPGDRVSASQIVADLSKAVAAATGKPEAVRSHGCLLLTQAVLTTTQASHTCCLRVFTAADVTR